MRLRRHARQWLLRCCGFAAGFLSVLVATRDPAPSRQGWVLGMERGPAENRSPAGEDPAKCPVTSNPVAFGEGMVVFVTESKEGHCIVRVSQDGSNYPKRAFTSANTGRFLSTTMVKKGTDGGHAHYFFPRKRQPGYELAADGGLDLILASGERFRVSAQGRLVSFSGGSVQESPEVDPGKAGLKIRVEKGIMMETPYLRGDPYYPMERRAENPSYFRDSAGIVCEVKNREVIDYSVPLKPVFKYREDRKLLAFLRSRCPKLDVSSLLDGETPPAEESAPASEPSVQAGAAR